jgi:hypothetical protein
VVPSPIRSSVFMVLFTIFVETLSRYGWWNTVVHCCIWSLPPSVEFATKFGGIGPSLGGSGVGFQPSPQFNFFEFVSPHPTLGIFSVPRGTHLFFNPGTISRQLSVDLDSTCRATRKPCVIMLFNRVSSYCSTTWRLLGGATWHHMGVAHGTFQLAHVATKTAKYA